MNTNQNIDNNLSGLILIDKDAGITSHKVVSSMRKLLNIEKIGHLGTLDPFATGLLPILVGGTTKLSDELMNGKKQYLFTILLGIETDTLDSAGNIISRGSVEENFVEKITEVLSKFQGEIEQVPPEYSALKMNGRPLYEYMRSTGKLPNAIETKRRKIFIEKLEIVSFDKSLHSVTLRAMCSKGTYIRSLARDISKAIGTVGHCIQLRREYIEPWSVENAVFFSLKQSLEPHLLIKSLISPEQILPHFPKLVLGSEFLKPFSSGNVMFVNETDFENNAGLNLMRKENEKTKIFLSVKNSSQTFLSEVEFIPENNVFKVMPKKKIV